jgi:hypothetical protein
MKNLFDGTSAVEITTRLERLEPGATPRWGTMNAAQVMAHCAIGMEMSLGDFRPPRMLIGRLIGWAIKPLALRDDEPMRPNSPTVPEMRVADERDFGAERLRLRALIDRFVAAGPACCTTHPHPFFGRLTPDEWAIQMYKHLDHHLRQLGG